MALSVQPTILVIDDESVIRRSIHLYLEDYDYRVLEADNGRAGLEIYEREKVDLVLVDLRMPEVGGLQVLSQVRAATPDMPVIVVSGAGDIGDVVEALRLGAWDYLMKPIDDMSILRHAVEKGLERARMLEENKQYQTDLEERVSRKTRELRETNLRLCDVVESTKKLLGCGDIRESGAMILTEFARQMDAGGGSIYEVAEQSLRCIHSLDEGHALPLLPLPLKEGSVFARAFTGREPVFISDISTIPGISPSGFSDYGDDSLLVFPFIDRTGKPLAVVSLHSKRHPPFVAQDREIGAILASYACEALQTARAVAAMQRSEELMLQAQKMEAIGTLAGGIAHDFNNILSAIVGYTDLSLFADDCPEGVRRNLEQIKKGGRRARDLVRQILSFSRTEAHNEGPVDVSPIIKEALKLLRATIPSSITIQRRIPTGLGLIKIDPGRIHQVLMNLCTNAAHAMQGRSGILNVEFSRVRTEDEYFDLHEVSAPVCLKLYVSDTGRGMSPEVIARIFDPYFTTKEKGEGAGLGLAVVHGIVRACGGAIRVESEERVGSQFHLYFPCIDLESSEVTDDNPFEMPRGNERILFVDDEETLAVMAGEMLKNLGYAVEVMTSSAAALERFIGQPDAFDLIITDQTMPDFTGLQLAREVLGQRPGMPIVLYTGYSTSIDGEEARRIGIREMMMKPLSMTNLALTVRRVLDVD
jgi:signal transduction histidine kinase/DNA-binding response OmpR family regulator